jgi:hypothetical protein
MDEWSTVEQKLLEWKTERQWSSRTVLECMVMGEQLMEWLQRWSGQSSIIQGTFAWQDVIQECTRQLQQTIEADRRQLHHLTDILQQSQQQCKQLQEQYDKVVAQLHVQQQSQLVSSIRGKKAEDQWAGALQELFPLFTLENKSKVPQSGDFWLTDTQNLICLIDLKCYSGVVQKREVDKFFRDMEASPVHMGMMLSTDTGIACHPHMSLAFVGPQMKPVLFLTHVNGRKPDIPLAYQVLSSLSTIIQSSTNLIESSQLRLKLQTIIDLQRTASQNHQEFQQLHRHLEELIRRQDDMWKVVFESIQSILK